ncbi:MAG: putative Ig domain-containing protein [Bradyrhizobium sp.]
MPRQALCRGCQRRPVRHERLSRCRSTTPAEPTTPRTFTIIVAGVNSAPVLAPLATEIDGKENQALKIPVKATDVDGDKLIYWANNLPPGATFDAQQLALIWTPGFQSAGTYTNVTFVVSDGLHEVSEATTIVIAPTPQPPTFIKPSDFTAGEGDTIRIALQASDPHGATLTYASDLLPPGGFLDEKTGIFTWTPDYTQHGVYVVPFTVSNGEASTTQTVTNRGHQCQRSTGVPEPESVPGSGGQNIQFRVQAFDPDNPTFTPPDRASDGTLVHSDLNIPTVTYTLNGMPQSATFDPDTLMFSWTPGFGDAGQHVVTITATDDGDGTGHPLSVTQSRAALGDQRQSCAASDPDHQARASITTRCCRCRCRRSIPMAIR